MKTEWRKTEKALYLPKAKPELVTVPAQQFIIVTGTGNPNEPVFAERVSALYSVAYALKMGLKQDPTNEHPDFTVYPLEGLWSSTTKPTANQPIDKSQLIYQIMIRQPEFVTAAMFQAAVAKTAVKKPNSYLKELKLETITDGDVVQILHVGTYDTEATTFAILNEYLAANHLQQRPLNGYIHREIYLSDPRRIAPEKQKTVLRIGVNPK